MYIVNWKLWGCKLKSTGIVFSARIVQTNFDIECY